MDNPENTGATALRHPGWQVLEEAAVEAKLHPSDFECSCDEPIGERPFLLCIVEGEPSLTCVSCNKSLPYADWWGEEALEVDPIRVRLTVHVENEADNVYVWVQGVAEPASNGPSEQPSDQR